MSANDSDDYIRARSTGSGVPLPSTAAPRICLGAQMLAMHLGARSRRIRKASTQIGSIRSVPPPPATPCAGLAEQVYHWHREGFELPAGAELLAEGDTFRTGLSVRPCLRFQFHPDVTYAMMHCWTARGYDRMDSPGVRGASQHFADRAVYDVASRAWLKALSTAGSRACRDRSPRKPPNNPRSKISARARRCPQSEDVLVSLP